MYTVLLFFKRSRYQMSSLWVLQYGSCSIDPPTFIGHVRWSLKRFWLWKWTLRYKELRIQDTMGDTDGLIIDRHQITICSDVWFAGFEMHCGFSCDNKCHYTSGNLSSFMSKHSLNVILQVLDDPREKPTVWILLKLNWLFRTKSAALEQDHVNKQQCKC